MSWFADLLLDEVIPDPLFAPPSEDKKNFYDKLAVKAMKNVRWTQLALLFILLSMASQMWSSGTTIYHCFQMEKSEPRFYREIDISICKNANNGTLTVTIDFWDTFWRSVPGFNDPYYFLTTGLFGFLGFYICLVTGAVQNSIKLLAYDVKLTRYGVSAFFNFSLGAYSASLLLSLLKQGLTHLTDVGDQIIYFWGYPNYPETFWGFTIRLLKNLGIIGGMVKIMLKSLNDPLDFYCSMTDILQVESYFIFQDQEIKYTTSYSYIGWANYFLFATKFIRQNSDEDQQVQKILTALNREKLLLPYLPPPNQLGMIERFLGFGSYRFENKIRALISKVSLSVAEFRELEDVLRALILNLFSKRWPKIFLFSMGFTLRSAIWEFGREGDVENPIQSLFLLHFVAPTLMMFFIESRFAYFVSVLSLAGATFLAFWVTQSMLMVLNDDNYYLPSICFIILMSFIQIIGVLKMIQIIYWIQKSKKRLSTGPNENVHLALPLNPE
jgi:hypothetical protein